MLIEQIFLNNGARNFNYLIACEETGEALAIDPLGVDECLAVANKHNWKITQIVNTHEHWDHVGGNEKLRMATGAKLLAHAKAQIDGIEIGLQANDSVKVGSSVVLKVLDTPGHTLTHICLLADIAEPALFCGDTLFNAGAGNCHNGGHPAELYVTFTEQLAKLADNTRVYPGHDYITNNLGFTLDRFPNNTRAKALLAELKQHHDPFHPLITTLAFEKEINVFFQLDNPEVIERLRDKFALPQQVDAKTVFLKLRELRNQW